ncbi:hypothetical protein Pyn_10281 [Prunus yedoensis var. nudiflora]|uniref:Uncharacterized protein n=1 Tax=Prunus yedoensis var. nudiflora TaxID=2094558 RepID=A0A314UBD5_PRUYE|nr:hypothetical protein Pyn_10281 [Prunus yedoensis var. nudiflora]
MAGMAARMLIAAEWRKEGGLMVVGVLEQPRDVGRWLMECLQQPKDRVGNRECLKNISFAYPHWRTPSNGLGLWCS